MEPLRTCNDCGFEAYSQEELDLFSSSSSSKYGKQNLCKSCNKLRTSTNIENRKAEVTIYQKQYRDKHKEAASEYSKIYRANNKDKIVIQRKEAYINNPEPYKERNRKRRALSADVNESYTKEDSAYTFLLFNHKCFNCGASDSLCVDHHYPLSKGYALTRTNAVILCSFCNSSKHDKMPEEFYSEEKLTLLLSHLQAPSHSESSQLTQSF